MAGPNFVLNKTAGMKTTERMTAWRCIGCGRLDAPQTCIGVCQDRKVELVDACEYDRMCELLKVAREQAQALKGVLNRLVHATPRAGELERNYRALQQQAHKILVEFADSEKYECKAG